MKKTIAIILNLILNIFPLFVYARENMSLLPEPSIIDAVQTSILWIAGISSILSLLLLMIFGSIYLLKDTEGKKKVRKMLFYSLIVLTVSLFVIVIIQRFFTNYTCF